MQYGFLKSDHSKRGSWNCFMVSTSAKFGFFRLLLSLSGVHVLSNTFLIAGAGQCVWHERPAESWRPVRKIHPWPTARVWRDPAGGRDGAALRPGLRPPQHAALQRGEGKAGPHPASVHRVCQPDPRNDSLGCRFSPKVRQKATNATATIEPHKRYDF